MNILHHKFKVVNLRSILRKLYGRNHDWVDRYERYQRDITTTILSFFFEYDIQNNTYYKIFTNNMYTTSAAYGAGSDFHADAPATPPSPIFGWVRLA